MATLKPRDVEGFLRKPDFSKPVILLYGPDEGLVSERADLLAKKTGVDLSDPFSLIRMDADEAASDTARIADEAHTINMFGGKRLIRISGNTRRDLAKAVKPVLDTPPEDALIIVEAGDLKKSSALRKQLETNTNALCIACYQDNDAALEQLIKEEIIDKGLSIEPEAKSTLRSMLGDNRRTSRGELQKLALYCHDEKAVTLTHIHDIVGDASKLIMDDLIDSAVSGNQQKMQVLFPKVLDAGNSPDIILLNILRFFQLLQIARSKVELQRKPATSVIAEMRPPIHFSRKNAVTNALKLWPLRRIEGAMSRLDKAMLECRMQAALSQSLAGTALLAIAIEASALRRK